MRPAALIVAALLATACKKQEPAETVHISYVAQTTDGVELRFTLRGAGLALAEPETGTIVYSVFDGLPSSGREPACEARGTISKESYRVPKDVEHTMEVRPTWTKPCPPASTAKRYGVVTFIAADGKIAKSGRESMVPQGIGGSGRFEFADLDAKNAGVDAGPTPGERGAALAQRLRALAANATADDVPVGRPCPTHAPVKSALRIDRRLVPLPGAGDLGPPEAAFRAVNDERAQALVRASQGGAAPTIDADVDFVELVKVDTFEPPKVTTAARPGTVGKYTPGRFEGEVWVVDLGARKVICRARTAGTSTADIKGKSYEVDANLVRAFYDEVGAAINRGARDVAPWLPNTWP